MTLASSRGRLRYTLYVFIFASFLFVRPGPGVRAASITVNANCSLPHAIIAANTDRAAGGCPAGSGADTIRLTYSTNLHDRGFCAVFGCDKQRTAFPKGLEVTSEITIEGNGYSISNALTHGPSSGHSRIFHVKSSGRLTVRYAYLVNSNYGDMLNWGSSEDEVGGAIRNEGHLTIDHCYVAGNHAFDGGAIYSSGTLIIKGSAFVRNAASKKRRRDLRGRRQRFDIQQLVLLALSQPPWRRHLFDRSPDDLGQRFLPQ